MSVKSIAKRVLNFLFHPRVHWSIHTLRGFATLIFLILIALAGIYAWLNSAAFEGIARRRLIAQFEEATGGRAELGGFHWNPLKLEAEADDLVIHGNEAASDEPYIRVSRVHASFTVFGLLTPRIHLRELDVERPAIHLIYRMDGSSNVPVPHRSHAADKNAIDELFALQVAHIAVTDGVALVNEQRHLFDVDARDFELSFVLNPASFRGEDHYRIDTTLSNLSLKHGLNMDYTKAAKDAPTAKFRVEAGIDLTRDTLTVDKLELVSSEHRLDAQLKLQHFSQPEWEGKASGEFELGLLQPLVGFDDTPSGLAHLKVTASGKGGDFQVDGPVHVDNAIYAGIVPNKKSFTLDARAHADKSALKIENIDVRFNQGGQITGDVALRHWLAAAPGTPGYGVRPTGLNLSTLRSWDLFVPVDAVVTTQFSRVPINTIMGIVAGATYEHLGMDGVVSGPANADWTGGDIRTIKVSTRFGVAPSGAQSAGAATTGVIDATYTQSNGAVDVHQLELDLPSSHIAAHGRLGAYPITSPTGLVVDFRTANLNEFDGVLRSLGYARNGQQGVAALPAKLNGELNFKGQWNGSLLDPHLMGEANASQIAFEVPTASDAAEGKAPTQPKWIAWDTVEATGSYSATHLVIEHGRLNSPNRALDVSGSLDAAVAKPRDLPAPAFDGSSNVHLKVTGHGIDMSNVYDFTGKTLPVTGTIATQFEVSGQLQHIYGTGWVQLANANIYGETVSRLHIHGDIDGEKLNVSSLIVNTTTGSVAAHGSLDFAAKRYSFDAHGSGLELESIHALKDYTGFVSGALNFSGAGTGSFADPHFEVHASIDRFQLLGASYKDAKSGMKRATAEKSGAVVLSAYAANHVLKTDVEASFDGASLLAHGSTMLDAHEMTHAEFSLTHFNLGTISRLAHLEQLNASSSIDGVFTLDGPLAQTNELKGEAKIAPLVAKLRGVELRSNQAIHATLTRGTLTLDPVHVTGEDTDLNFGGTLAFGGAHELHLSSKGAVNLKLAETLDRDLTASGSTNFEVEVGGTLEKPKFNGGVNVENGALSLEDLPNGLSQLHGRLEFNQNRLEVRSLTAMTGGGVLSVNGYLGFDGGLLTDLTVTGKSIRIRYPQGVSAIGDANLHLQGVPSNLLLSGNVLITRFSLNPDLDIAALATQASAVRPIPPLDAPSNHIRLDVHVQSSPQLSFQNAFAKLAGNVNLNLRGTVANPSLLGRVVVTEGSATIAGTHYDLEHGEILFDNPIRIQPTINLNASAHVQDYDITLGIHGTFDKNSISYRSEPPLPQGDVIALLALGHTQEQQRLYTQQQESTANPTDALLGGALNATVSNRVSKLFGAATVKVDPNYLGTQGTTTSRVTVDEQLGRALKLTFATNANSTSQQLIQAEIAINHHVSLLVARDESGVFSMVLKATRKHK